MHRLALLALLCTAAFGQSYETWVSTTGNDANACTLAFQCRTFQGALNKTLTGGTVRVANAGDFGTFSLTMSSKDVTIDGGGQAVIESDTNTTPAISLALASSIVTLRNLTIHEIGANASGITASLTTAGGVLSTSSILNLENVTIRIESNLGGVSVSGDGSSQVNMRNVSILAEGANFGINLQLSGGSTPMQATMENVSIKGASTGLNLLGVSGAVRDSVFTANSTGLEMGGNISTLSLLVDRCELSFNGDGILTSTAGTLRLSNSSISGNGANGIDSSAGGTVISFRNNVIAGNAVDGAPALSTSLR